MDPRETLYIARNIQRSIDRRRAELKRLKEFETYLSATDYSSVVVKHSADRGSVERIATSGKLATLERVIGATCGKQGATCCQCRTCTES